MQKTNLDVKKAVLYSVSGGFLATMFGLLASPTAQAEPSQVSIDRQTEQAKKATTPPKNEQKKSSAEEGKRKREKEQGQSSSAVADRDVAKEEKDGDRVSGSSAAADRNVERSDKKKERDGKAKAEERKRKREKDQGQSSSSIADRDVDKEEKDGDRVSGSSAAADRNVERNDKKKERDGKAKAEERKRKREKDQGQSSSSIADRDVEKEEDARGNRTGSSSAADRDVEFMDKTKERDRKAAVAEGKRKREREEGQRSSAAADRHVEREQADRGDRTGSSAAADRDVVSMDKQTELERPAREKTAQDLMGALRAASTGSDPLDGILEKINQSPEEKRQAEQERRDWEATAPGRASYLEDTQGGAPGSADARRKRAEEQRMAQALMDYHDGLAGRPVGERTAEIIEPVGDKQTRVTNAKTGQSRVIDLPTRDYVNPATKERWPRSVVDTLRELGSDTANNMAGDVMDPFKLPLTVGDGLTGMAAERRVDAAEQRTTGAVEDYREASRKATEAERQARTGPRAGTPEADLEAERRRSDLDAALRNYLNASEAEESAKKTARSLPLKVGAPVSAATAVYDVVNGKDPRKAAVSAGAGVLGGVGGGALAGLMGAGPIGGFVGGLAGGVAASGFTDALWDDLVGEEEEQPETPEPPK